ncbi:hypothetical protein K8Q93_03470 [Candidatus Parcubacteria bacterium]|nr:hypothetical protein [Candidatus Parcubacteria bacterium]
MSPALALRVNLLAEMQKAREKAREQRLEALLQSLAKAKDLSCFLARLTFTQAEWLDQCPDQAAKSITQAIDAFWERNLAGLSWLDLPPVNRVLSSFEKAPPTSWVEQDGSPIGLDDRLWTEVEQAVSNFLSNKKVPKKRARQLAALLQKYFGCESEPVPSEWILRLDVPSSEWSR